jgi:oligoendopeptidase F
LITNIYAGVQTFKSSYQNYRVIVEKLLKKQLNLTKLEPWDKTVELSKKDTTYTIEQTKAIVLEALAPLGDAYVQNIKKALNER